MITKDSLSGLKKLRDNLSFEDNPDVSRANKAIGAANKEFIPVFGFLSGWTSGFDKETGEVMIFIPLENINDLSKVPDNIKKDMDIECVSNYQDIFDQLFKKHK